ncbi:MAG: hypothetical protein WD739_06715 [Actinomycetota bacterium]
MRGAYQFYRALHETDRAPAQCCSDEPEFARRVVGDDGRSAAPIRWARKLRPAVGVASTAFRTSIRRPERGAPTVGNRVIGPTGETFGHVQDLLIGVESGATTVAIAATSHPQQVPVYLVPDHALRRGTTPDEFVIDRRVLERARAA